MKSETPAQQLREKFSSIEAERRLRRKTDENAVEVDRAAALRGLTAVVVFLMDQKIEVTPLMALLQELTTSNNDGARGLRILPLSVRDGDVVPLDKYRSL